MIPAHELPTTSPVAADLAARLAAEIPVLQTPRLVLRAPRIGDFAAFAEIAMSPRGAGIGGPMTRDAAWADFMQVTGTWLLRGHGGWTVDDRQTGEILGFVLIGFEPGDAEPELGYLFREAAEGRGLASEAAAAARGHAFATLKLPGLVSYVAATNGRSIRLAERLGARRDNAAEAALGDGTLVFRHPAPDGNAQRGGFDD